MTIEKWKNPKECYDTGVKSLWKQPTLVCQSLSVTKKKENHHDNPVKGEWFLLCIELVV